MNPYRYAEDRLHEEIHQVSGAAHTSGILFSYVTLNADGDEDLTAYLHDEEAK